jgi:aryl-alcohol dehydrogenase-like predicted oxidoreductase
MKDGDDDTYNEAVIGPFLKDLSRDSFTVASKFMPAKWDNKCDYATVRHVHPVVPRRVAP